MYRYLSLSNAVFAILFLLLVYTRVVGLDWGLPYPMHPDERNMVIAIQNMVCTPGEPLSCFDPEFWAYGQFPLYSALLISKIISIGKHPEIISSETATLSLRVISALASVIMSMYLYRLVVLLGKVKGFLKSAVFVFTIFVPSFIQFAHFGTTESLLMMFVTVMVYYSYVLLVSKQLLRSYVKTTGVIFGLAVGTKVSAAIFAVIPLATIFLWYLQKRSWEDLGQAFFALIKIAALSVMFFIIVSPYNVIRWEGFIHSMNYESAVGLGTFQAFYTRSFEYTIPVVFQFARVLPYALGWPLFILGLAGFLFLSWNNKILNFLRVILVVIFLGNALMYAKWTRFIAPAFPLFIVFSILIMLRVSGWAGLRVGVLKRLGIGPPAGGWIFIILFLFSIFPGIAYVSIYKNPDVRFAASQWIYENIPPGAKILSETANVVDIPMPNPLVPIEIAYGSNLHPISFDFYEVDNNPQLEEELSRHLEEVDYIFVPSRRIYWNHTCYTPISNSQFQISNYTWNTGFSNERCSDLQKKYPVLHAYYTGLFDGSLGFEQVAEFSSFPRIELFGRTIISFPDEAAEETWTVFDHPVVRVYKRIDL